MNLSGEYELFDTADRTDGTTNSDLALEFTENGITINGTPYSYDGFEYDHYTTNQADEEDESG